MHTAHRWGNCSLIPGGQIGGVSWRVSTGQTSVFGVRVGARRVLTVRNPKVGNLVGGLGAGAVALGLGVAMASGTGVAQAGSGDSAGPSSSGEGVSSSHDSGDSGDIE